MTEALSEIEEIRLKRRHKDTINVLLTESTCFTRYEVENLLVIYHKIQMSTANPSLLMEHSHLKRVLIHGLCMWDLQMHPYILAVANGNYGKYVTYYRFVKLMALYLHGTLEEKIDYCFAVYCAVGVTDRLYKRHMTILVQNYFINDPDAAEDLVDLLIKKLDVDRDGAIDYEDYRDAVLRNPLLMECFGKVLPDRRADLIDLLIKKLDVDRDGVIDYEYYGNSVLRNPLLLECFGRILHDTCI